jgi:hypothetical protein
LLAATHWHRSRCHGADRQSVTISCKSNASGSGVVESMA